MQLKKEEVIYWSSLLFELHLTDSTTKFDEGELAICLTIWAVATGYLNTLIHHADTDVSKLSLVRIRRKQTSLNIF
jgi:hypothetical protein